MTKRDRPHIFLGQAKPVEPDPTVTLDTPWGVMTAWITQTLHYENIDEVRASWEVAWRQGSETTRYTMWRSVEGGLFVEAKGQRIYKKLIPVNQFPVIIHTTDDPVTSSSRMKALAAVLWPAVIEADAMLTDLDVGTDKKMRMDPGPIVEDGDWFVGETVSEGHVRVERLRGGR